MDSTNPLKCTMYYGTGTRSFNSSNQDRKTFWLTLGS